MVSKDKPSYSLALIKKTFSRVNDLNMTFSAMAGQYELGLSDQDVVDAIQALDSKDFYKSMPPKNPLFSGWHDVYKSHFLGEYLYIKFQFDKHGKVIISFKAVRN